MICEWCGCFFCDDHVKDHEVFSRDVKKYCTRTCGNQAKAARAKARKCGEPLPVNEGSVRQTGPPCPTGNVRYQTEQAAEQAAGTWLNGQRGAGLHLAEKVQPYQCPECQDWHYDKSAAFFAAPPSTRFIREPNARSQHPRRPAGRPF